MRWMLAAAACAAIAVVPLPLTAQEHDHDQAHGVHSHRGPGPHFIDAFYTENAYLERKIRPDVFVSVGEAADRYTAQVEVEWAVLPRAALIVHAPVHHVVPQGAPSETGIGDLELGAKVALVNDRRRFILAAGADLELPTGDASRGLGEEHAALAPFLLGWLPFGPDRRWLLQTAAHLEVPLEANPATEVVLSMAISWTSPLGVTPLVEGLVHFEGSDPDPVWAVAPGFRWEFAPAWEVGAGVRIPVAGPAEEEVGFVAGLIRHFPLPR